MLAHGADKDARDSESNATPLIMRRRWVEPVVGLLLERGADVTPAARRGFLRCTQPEQRLFARGGVAVSTAQLTRAP